MVSIQALANPAYEYNCLDLCGKVENWWLIWGSTSDAKQSPWSSARENGIDSLAVRLILTIGHPADFTYYHFLNKNQFPSKLNIVKKKVKSTGWLIIGISQTARESIPFSLALDQGYYFASEVERHTYHQLPTLPHRSELSWRGPVSNPGALPTEVNRPLNIPGFYYFYRKIIQSKSVLLSIIYYVTLKYWNPRGKMEQILLAYRLINETVTAIMILYKDTEAMAGTEWSRALR